MWFKLSLGDSRMLYSSFQRLKKAPKNQTPKPKKVIADPQVRPVISFPEKELKRQSFLQVPRQVSQQPQRVFLMQEGPRPQ